MKILIDGSEGAQGRRYQAILRHLGHDILRSDRILHSDQMGNLADADAFIIATPTICHISDICTLMRFKKPILCEKPISTNIEKVRLLASLIKRDEAHVSCVMQYAWAYDDLYLAGGLSSYDYFRHGNDGLIWDCYQIIALAEGDVFLRETSPVWHCEINGTVLNIARMDQAYVDNVKHWISTFDKQVDFSFVLQNHEAVAEYERTHGEN